MSTDISPGSPASSPRVSIITICKDAGTALAETINSVLAQSYPNIEYLIIDSASGADTRAVLATYKDRVDYLVSEPDRGISHAFNKGIEQANGTIIGLLNAGDTYLPDTVAQAAKALADASAGFCYGDCLFTESSEYQFLMRGEADYLNRLAYRMPVFNHPTVFVKKAVYDQCGGFDEQYKTSMDYEILYRIIRAGHQGLYIPNTLAVMDRQGLSITNNRQALREVKAISLRYGLAAWKAWGYYAFGVFKEVVGQPIRRRFGTGLTRWYRRKFIRGYGDD